MEFELVIRNGTVVTASEVTRADVGIRDGKIAAIADKLEGNAKTIDATGKLVMPGGVEIHTHIDGMLHGMRTVDDWFYASLGAAAGGTTTVVDFPLQGKDQTLLQTIEEFKGRADGKSIIDFAFTPSISKFTEETYSEIPELIRSGVPSFKVFMVYDWRVNDDTLAHTMDVVGKNGGILSVHCENGGMIDYLSKKAIAEGRTGVEWHAPTRPVSTEVEATARVISLSKEMNVPVLCVHMSVGPAVVDIAKARAEGVMVYGETMPHFMLLDESEYKKPGYEAMKVVITPPLRSKDHQEILWDGLRSGALQTVGSDHCAFPYADKVRLFETRGSVFTMIPHGAPGIETRFPLVFSEGVSNGRLSLTKFVEVISTNPAKLAGLYPKKGTLAIGSDADIVLVDPQKEVTIKQEMLHGKTGYSPFEGWKVKGYPVTTISRGQIVVENGEFVGERGHGKFLKRDEFKPF